MNKKFLILLASILLIGVVVYALIFTLPYLEKPYLENPFKSLYNTYVAIFLFLVSNSIIFGLPAFVVGFVYKSIPRGTVVLCGTFFMPQICSAILLAVFYAGVHPTGEATIGYCALSFIIGLPLGWILGIIIPVIIFVSKDRKKKRDSNQKPSGNPAPQSS